MVGVAAGPETQVVVHARRFAQSRFRKEIAMNTGSTAAAVRQSSSGSLDGVGAGDHDLSLGPGGRPRASAPYPFSTRQYARLLVLRGRVREALGPEDLRGLDPLLASR